MRYVRLLLAAVLVGLAVAACSSPTVPLPQPDDGGSNPPNPPNPGFVAHR